MLYNETADDKPEGSEKEEDVVLQAVDRYKAIMEWEGEEAQRSREDRRFSIGDARNNAQWPEHIWNQRSGKDSSDLPSLTINKVRVHNDIIINEMSKHGFGVKIRPAAGKASVKSANVMMSIVRHIQNISKYSTQRRRVAEHQVDGGIGYIVLDLRFVSNKSRNQDIYLRAPRDPTAVMLDPWIQEPDGSDAKFGFEIEKIPRKEFNRKYPQWKNKVGAAPLGTSQLVPWITANEIIIAKYWRKVQKPDRYIWYKDENGNDGEKLESEIKKETRGEKSKLAIFNALMDDIKEGRIEGGSRKVFDDKVEWFRIAGDTVIDKGDWAGKYIPICRAVGRETVIDNTLDRKGHTRLMIDPQRMMNYAASCAVESVAGTVKAQFLAPLRAIDGMEDRWKDANLKRYGFLPWNDVDENAMSPEMQKIDPPIPLEQAKPNAGWLQVGQDAERHMMMVSGQYQAQLGEQDNQSAASGKAIGQRQEQADTATFHFAEHLRDMDTFIGVQLIDLIPKIYDTKRTLQVEDEKGELSWIMIDPDQQEALRELKDVKDKEEAVKLALNPSLGEYECVSDPGPSWATQREEAWDSIAMILQQSKELVAVVGDLLFKFGDFEGCDEIMERIRKEIEATKPYLFSDQAPTPAMQELQQKYNETVSLNTDLMTKLAEEKLKVRGRDERRDIDAFKAETDRMRAEIEAIKEAMPSPQQAEQMRHEIETQVRQHVFNLIETANQANIDAESQASDQEHERGLAEQQAQAGAQE